MTIKKSAKSVRNVSTKRPLSSSEPLSAVQDEGVLRFPVVEETLQVTKKVVDKGGYQLTKIVENREQLVDELLRTEQVTIERRKIDTAISADAVPQTRQEGDTLIVPVIEEVLVTVKQLMLVEEVRVTRLTGFRQDPQTFKLRKERINVDRLAADPELADKPV